MFAPADVIRYEDYEFWNPVTCMLEAKVTKLFIVLHPEPCLVLKTTSQDRRYLGARPGCRQDLKTLMISGGQESSFPLDTYVQLPQIITLPKENLDVRIQDGRIVASRKLSDACFRLVKLCLKQFKRDIAPAYWQPLFGN
ncbi:MAG: hypothetical protein P9X24_15430 [Candidatus Hatepunaea meridiana]|nr:hypothetical protein [Candidatus Hatepunaea meridiana]